MGVILSLQSHKNTASKYGESRKANGCETQCWSDCRSYTVNEYSGSADFSAVVLNCRRFGVIVKTSGRMHPIPCGALRRTQSNRPHG